MLLNSFLIYDRNAQWNGPNWEKDILRECSNSNRSYYFEYHQYDSYTNKPSKHFTTNINKLKKLFKQAEINFKFDNVDAKVYPSLCTIDKVWRLKDFDYNNFNKIWENSF